jgi:hypothetical protein
MDNFERSSRTSLLTDEVIEIILAFLPITDLLNAALVCKEWRSFIASSHLLRALSFSIHASKPWLFVLGQSKSLLPAKNRVMGFDPLAWRWNRIGLPALMDSNCGGPKKLEECRGIMMNVEEGNGILFYPAGRRINYTLRFLNPKCEWVESASMSCWRHQQPVVCYLGGPTYNHIFVVGGVCDFEGEEIDPLCAEMLDLNSGVWELLDPLPHQFKASASSTWLSSAVFSDRIYLLERYSGDCCYFDLEMKRWKIVGKLRPPPPPSPSVVHDEQGGLIIVSGNSKKGLVVGGLRRDDGGMSFRLWKFNNIVDKEATNIECTEMDRMPSHIFNLVTGKDEEEEVWESSDVKCKGMGDLIYIYSDRSEHVCVCDISGHGQVWRMLPNRDGIFVGTFNYSSRFKYVCSPVALNQISL